MTVGFSCFVTRGKLAEKIPQGRLFEKNKRYWFYTDGTPFPQEDIGVPWSNSTYRALNDDSGGFLGLIVNPDLCEAVRLNAPEVQKFVEKIREHVSVNAPEYEIEKGEGLSYITIRNLLVTFDKMIAKHGSNAYFCIS